MKKFFDENFKRTHVEIDEDTEPFLFFNDGRDGASAGAEGAIRGK